MKNLFHFATFINICVILFAFYFTNEHMFVGFARTNHYLQKDKNKTLLQSFFKSIFLNTWK